MDDITTEQKKIVDELRRRTINGVTPKMLEDISLFYRFAKARDFNLIEAEVMLKNHISWRNEMQIDTILIDYEPPEVLIKYGATSFICFDKKGSIVRHIDCGRTDAKSLWNVIKKEELAKYFAYIIEKDKDVLIKRGSNLGTTLLHTTIYDFEGLTYSNAISIKTLQYLTYTMKMFLDNFPETIRFLFAINAPVYFTWIFSALKQITPKAVFQKTRICGTDGWKDQLMELIEPSELPAFLGGTKTDPDGNPLCETLVLRGQPIPRSYLLTKRSGKLSVTPDAEKLIVKPFSKEEICFYVKERNSYLEWEFETKNKDIEFSLSFKREGSENSKPVELIPRQRIEAEDGPEKGCLKCEKAGIYIMAFDNTCSWLHSKEVLYKAEIQNLKDDEINL